MYLVTALLLVAVLVVGCAAPSGTASTAPQVEQRQAGKTAARQARMALSKLPMSPNN